jgi:uncharacterized protein (TIGR00369 family)
MSTALAADALAQLLRRNLPAVDHRGEIVEEVGADFVRLRLPMRAEYVGPASASTSGAGIVSGPITMGFADTALYACVHAFYGEDVVAVIASLNVSFLRAARNADLVATARLLKRGKSLAFVEAHLHSDGSSDACAHVTATYAVRALARP